MISFPCAKINIGLHVLEKRADDYHNLETLFYPLPLHDALEILPSSELDIQITGADLGPYPFDNLCVKAFRLLEDDFAIAPVSIHLLKRIPAGAGLGGGSSDAAAMLGMLNAYYKLDLSPEMLEEYALKLGSDCPFFIKGKPGLATGRGEQLKPVELDLSGTFILLVKPPFQSFTKEAFSGVRPGRPLIPLSESIQSGRDLWKDRILNDFEISLFPIYPELKLLKEEFYAKGAFYASLSGSGSVVYGLFNQQPKPDEFEKFGKPFMFKL